MNSELDILLLTQTEQLNLHMQQLSEHNRQLQRQNAELAVHNDKLQAMSANFVKYCKLLEQKNDLLAQENHALLGKLQQAQNFQLSPQFYETLQQELQVQLQLYTQRLLEDLDLTAMLAPQMQKLIPPFVTQQIAEQIQPLARKLQLEYQALRSQIEQLSQP